MTTVAFILERLGNGGAERVTAILANSLSKLPLEYSVHVFTYVHEENEYPLPENVTRHILFPDMPVGGFKGLLAKSRYLLKELRSIGPDYVISLATPKTSILLTLLSRIRNYKLILSERNDPNQYPDKKLLRRLRDAAYKHADGIVFQTPDAQQYFAGRIKVVNTVIPNPVSSSIPKPYTGPRENRIVNFCRLEPQKNIKLLLSAFAKIAEKYSDYTLEIYGIGPQSEELKLHADSLGIEKKVVWGGFVRNVHEMVRNAALFVSSSDYEGISNSMIEALALGMPTICTDCPIGGARLMIQNGINGLLVPVGDESALVAAMDSMLSDPNKAASLGLEAAKVRKEYSADVIAEKWIRFMEDT